MRYNIKDNCIIKPHVPLDLRIEDRVLLVLFEMSTSSIDEFKAPDILTQPVLATTVGVLRPSLARAIKPLVQRGLVKQEKRHIKNLGKKKSVYIATEKGIGEGQRIYRMVQECDLKVKCDDHEYLIDVGTVHKIIVERLGANVKLFQIAFTISNHSEGIAFYDLLLEVAQPNDKEKISEGKGEAGKGFNYVPEVSDFFGRDKEIRALKRCLRTHSKPLIVVHGIAGIGKTTLVAKVIHDLLPQINGFWQTIMPLNSPQSIVYDLGRWVGGKAKDIVESMARKGNIDPVIAIGAIIEEISHKNWVIVLDDVQNANTDTRNFLVTLVRMAMDHGGYHVVLISRRAERIDPRWRPRCLYIHLKGLDMANVRKFLETHRHFSTIENLRKIYAVTRGHPLALLLLSKAGVKTGIRDFREFLHEECITPLSDNEIRFLKVITLLRTPAVTREILKILGLQDCNYMISSLTEKGYLVSHGIGISAMKQITIHDMIKDLMSEVITESEKTEIHEKLADYYETMLSACKKDIDLCVFVTEECYHLLESNNLERCLKLVETYGEYIVTMGYRPFFDIVRSLYSILKERGRMPEKIVEIMADIEGMDGNIDEALRIYEHGAKKRKGLGGRLYSKIGMLYATRGDVSSARDMIRKSITKSINEGDYSTAGLCYNNLGILQIRQAFENRTLKNRYIKYLKDALDSFRKARTMLATLGMETSVAIAMMNEAYVLALMGNKKRAQVLMDSVDRYEITDFSSALEIRSMKCLVISLIDPISSRNMIKDVVKDLINNKKNIGDWITRITSHLLETYENLGMHLYSYDDFKILLSMYDLLSSYQITREVRVALHRIMMHIQKYVVTNMANIDNDEIAILEDIATTYETVVRGVIPEEDIGYFYAIMGRLMESHGKYENALAYYSRCARILKNADETIYLLEVFKKIAICHSKLNNKSSAIRFLKKALKMAEKVGYREKAREFRAMLKHL